MAIGSLSQKKCTFQSFKQEDIERGDSEFLAKFDRQWYVKFKGSNSLSEVLGYQLATALKIPVQPFVGFFVFHSEAGLGSPVKEGILIERMDVSKRASIDNSEVPKELIGRALALSVLDRFEWGEWLFDGNGEARFVDLERIGPNLFHPPQRTQIRPFVDQISSVFEIASKASIEARAENEFFDGLLELKSLNFEAVVDFSGHPFAAGHEKTAVKALENAVWELRRIIDGVSKPSSKSTRIRKMGTTRRKKMSFVVEASEEQFGKKLFGRIKVNPIRRNRWCVRWDIGSLDFNTALSTYFMTDWIRKEMGKLCESVESESSYTRWGSAIFLDETEGVEFAKNIQALWKRVIECFVEINPRA